MELTRQQTARVAVVWILVEAAAAVAALLHIAGDAVAAVAE